MNNKKKKAPAAAGISNHDRLLMQATLYQNAVLAAPPTSRTGMLSATKTQQSSTLKSTARGNAAAAMLAINEAQVIKGARKMVGVIHSNSKTPSQSLQKQQKSVMSTNREGPFWMGGGNQATPSLTTTSMGQQDEQRQTFRERMRDYIDEGDLSNVDEYQNPKLPERVGPQRFSEKVVMPLSSNPIFKQQHHQQRRLYSSSPSMPEKQIIEFMRAQTLEDELVLFPSNQILSCEELAAVPKLATARGQHQRQLHHQKSFASKLAYQQFPTQLSQLHKVENHRRNMSKASNEGGGNGNSIFCKIQRGKSTGPKILTSRDKSGRSTIILQTTQKTHNNSSKRMNTASFAEVVQIVPDVPFQSFKTLEDEYVKVSLINREDEGEILDDSIEIMENVTLPRANQSKSKERIVVNQTQNWGTAIKSRHDQEGQVVNLIDVKVIVQAPAGFDGQTSSNFIYKSSPTKAAGMNFTKQTSTQNPPQIHTSQIKGKTVFMFKPAKLSSALTENTTTPEKKQDDIRLDITLDLSDRGFNIVPHLQTVLGTQSLPTIIDLRKNFLIEVPQILFQLPSLKQLKLDQNQLTKLPDSIPDPQRYRVSSLSLSSNKLTSLPDWFYNNSRLYLEKLDISYNPEMSQISDGICNLENLKVLLMQGNNINSLPCAITRLLKIEEFGLEWWRYITIDDVNFGKKVELGMIRDETIVTNRQILRQIFEGLRLVNQSSNNQQTQPKRIQFCEFFRLYKKTFSVNKNEGEIHSGVHNLFQLICHFGHVHLIDQLLKDVKLNLHKHEQHFQGGQTPLQVALHISESDIFIKRILDHMGSSSFANFEVYQLRPNEELPLQRQVSHLHPLMIALKRKLLSMASGILDLMREDALKSQQESLSLDVKDENRNSIFHLVFQYLNEEECKDQALSLCSKLMRMVTQKSHVSKSFVGDLQIEVKLNEMNKQGMTPLDLAIELRINEAVEFALKCNRSEGQQYFSTNYNHNQRALTPLHRAVQSHNHLALFLLLQSLTCDALMRDKDFKKPRDYCQRMLFMQKMLRIAELFQLLTTDQSEKKRQLVVLVQSVMTLRDIHIDHQHPTNNSIVGSQLKGKKPPFKRCASDLKEHQRSKQQFDFISGATSEEKRPFKIEKPIALDRIGLFPYNKTIILERENSPKAIAIDKQDFVTFDAVRTKPPIVKDSVQKHKKPSISRAKSSHTRKISQMRPRMAQPNPHIQSIDKTSPGFIEDDDEPILQFQMLSGSVKKNTGNIISDVSGFDTFVFDEADASEESPTALPSNKFQYIMTVNNSKLARRPYYKRLLKNEFEHQFCQVMENTSKSSSFDFSKKIGILYQIYARAIQSKSENVKRDAKEFFAILTHELLDPVEGTGLQPLKNEIVYLNDRIQTAMEGIRCSFVAGGDGEEKKLCEIGQVTKQISITPIIGLRLPSATVKPSLKQSQFSNQSILEPSILKSGPILGGQQQTGNNASGPSESGLIMMKTLRQSVSLKSLINGISIQPSSNFTEAATSSIDAIQNVNFQSCNITETHKKKIINTQQYHQTAKSSYALIQHPMLLRNDTLERSPTSPRGNSGQVDSKQYINNQLTNSAEKSETTARQHFNSSDIKSPAAPSSSEYSMRSQPKRKQNLQILDSSIRTVSIHIDPSESKVVQEQEVPVGKHLKNRHSKILEAKEPFSPPKIMPNKKQTSLQHPKPYSVLSSTTSSTSLHRRYSKLAKVAVNYTSKNLVMQPSSALGVALSNSQQLLKNYDRRVPQKQFNARSTSTSHRHSMMSSRLNNASCGGKKTYQSQVQTVPQSIQLNQAMKAQSQVPAEEEEEDGYYRGATYSNIAAMNPGS